MPRSSRRIARALASALAAAVLLSVFALASPAAAATPGEDEQTFLTLLNQERVRAGLPAMTSDTRLAGTSRSWSSTMGSQDRLYHDPNLAAVASSVEPAWRSVGENVGVGYSASSLHTAFMNSPGHRANVMSGRFNRVGVGVVHTNGKLWVTVRFLEGPTISGTTGLEPTRSVAPAVPVQPITHACPTPSSVPFFDVIGTSYQSFVACVYDWAIAAGRTANEYGTGAAVTRGQMATFLANLLDVAGVTLPASPPDAFVDDDGTTHEHRINQLAAIGVVRGRTADTFGPGERVKRAEMATFLVRAHDKAADSPLPTGVDRFWDDDANAHEPNINKVGQAGLATGTSSTKFQPSASVTRGQMAIFVARTLDLLIEEGGVSAG